MENYRLLPGRASHTYSAARFYRVFLEHFIYKINIILTGRCSFDNFLFLTVSDNEITCNNSHFGYGNFFRDF